MDREDGVCRQRRSRFSVTLAEALEINRPAVVLDQNDGAGNSGGDFAIEEIIDGGELFARKLGVRRRPKLGSGGRHGGCERNRGEDNGEPFGKGPA